MKSGRLLTAELVLYLIGNDLYSYRENETGVASVKVLFVEYKSVARRSQPGSGVEWSVGALQ